MPQKLKRVIRLDSQPLNQTFFTSEGYLMDRPILTSVGIFEYTNSDGSLRRELRLPEDVFDPESLKSYRGKPIIVTHDAGLITKDNIAENSIGTILSEGYQSGDDVRAEIVIHDTDELKSSGYRELSLGYNVELDETPGVYEGEPYDAIQRNIRINHLALVDEARAGKQARLNIDSRDAALKGGKLVKKPIKKKPVHRNDGILSPEELKKAVAEYKARRAERLSAKADEEDTTLAAEEVAAAAVILSGKDENAEIIATTDDPGEIEKLVELIQDRRDRRDAAGDPGTLPEAEGVIAEQDKDIDALFDIIDTLLAQMAFDGEGEDPAECEGEGAETTNEDEDPAEGGDEVPADSEGAAEEDTEAEQPEDVNTDEDAEGAEDDESDEETPEVSAPVLNADSVDRIVRERVQIAKVAAQLNMDGLEFINPIKAKKTIIRAVKPGLRLDGKSKAYINAAFDMACQEVQKRVRKDTMYQRKQMFNSDSAKSTRAVNSTEAARQKMISRMQKTKEEK